MFNADHMMFSPKTLYELSVSRTADNFSEYSNELVLAPDEIQLDVLFECHKKQQYAELGRELQKPDVILMLLNVGNKRTELHVMFQAIIDFENNQLMWHINEELKRWLDKAPDNVPSTVTLITNCLKYSTFLLDAGWYCSSHFMLNSVLEKICQLQSVISNPRLVIQEQECLNKLLHAQSNDCRFEEAEHTYRRLLPLLAHSSAGARVASYLEFSSYSFLRSQYFEAFNWALEAVKLLSNDLPPKLVIDVLRQASKASVVRRQFAKAEILIHEAVLFAKQIYGTRHAKYADCLVDYGFYLLNVDCVAKSLQAYKTALEVRERCFGSSNINVAVAHEDLAYATYVFEYNSGRFEVAKAHAEKALAILDSVLPFDHLLLASSQRVLALILEEIAIDRSQAEKDESRQLLVRAEQLHLSALELAIAAFGEKNVQTAKHYGNLGRLYQTMEKYQQAEDMHIRAIQIKEDLLGKDDYEVALSIGHLASLYNYDLNEFSKAEQLYLRSIDIGLKLFGPGYSGLEYDYRGLIRVYQAMEQYDKLVDFTFKLNDWKEIRQQRNNDESIHVARSLLPISRVVDAITKE